MSSAWGTLTATLKQKETLQAWHGLQPLLCPPTRGVVEFGPYGASLAGSYLTLPAAVSCHEAPHTSTLLPPSRASGFALRLPSSLRLNCRNHCSACPPFPLLSLQIPSIQSPSTVPSYQNRRLGHSGTVKTKAYCLSDLSLWALFWASLTLKFITKSICLGKSYKENLYFLFCFLQLFLDPINNYQLLSRALVEVNKTCFKQEGEFVQVT